MKRTLDELEKQFTILLSDLRDSKPGDRSQIDRAYAVIVTMLEQAWAYFNTYLKTK